ncbi:MAG TPA: efflux RND transporter periplasmic adaptor subunit, partial [Oceanipulchritudo sp.]|nr:efflux RND transporter periplasmic adaptor subunit [Oceanipulchritudo sp.]
MTHAFTLTPNRRSLGSLTLILLSGVFLHSQPSQEEALLPVVAAPVIEEAAFGDTLEALGTTRAYESVLVTANVTEFVREIRFDDGEEVKAGDILVVLEKDEEEAALKSAKALLEERKASYNRARELEQQQALSTATLQERDALLQQIEGEIEAIEARLRDRVIRAPFDGTLGLREISPGALVRPGDTVTTIDDLSRIKVDFDAPSVFLSALRQGLEVEGRVAAYAETVFTGTVSMINSRVDPATRTVKVRAILPNEDRRLRPGLLMSIQLMKNPRSALLVPEGAIIQRGQESFVFALNRAGDKPIVEERRVELA